MAENGPIGLRYQLKETPRKSYSERTEWNVRDSDGTVIFTMDGRLKGGSRKTMQFACKLGKPWIHLAAERHRADHVAILRCFAVQHELRTLNVAGSRKSEEPGIERFVMTTLRSALAPRMSAKRILRILLLDDVECFRAICRAMLEKGFRVFEAENSETAFRIISRNRIDVVSTDFDRPDKLDGLQFTAAVKKVHPMIPILMITGGGFPDLRKKAFKAGVHSFLEKPFDREQLLSAIDHALSNVRSK